MPRLRFGHAGPYEGRCGGCGLYQCGCPVGFVDRLGYLRCTGCGEGEPISRFGVSATDRCEACGVAVLEVADAVVG
jgi:hypothetical protein